MSRSRTILTLMACGALLGGCATTDDVKVKNAAPVTAPADDQVPYSDNATVADYMSQGPVQIYSLDGPAGPIAMPSEPGAAQPRAAIIDGVQAGQDPNVMIFPFEDAAPNYDTAQMPMAPSMPPPTQLQHGLETPFPGGKLGDQIYFRHNSASLNAKDKEIVSQVAAGNPTTLRVEGHASERAAANSEIDRRVANLKVSMDRAFSVSRQLIREGVPASSIQTTAWGDTKPVSGVDGKDAEAASRRVDIIGGR